MDTDEDKRSLQQTRKKSPRVNSFAWLKSFPYSCSSVVKNSSAWTRLKPEFEQPGAICGLNLIVIFASLPSNRTAWGELSNERNQIQRRR
jgi:hypothetical protein